MKKTIVFIFFATVWFFSCKKGWKSTPEIVDTENSNSAKNIQNESNIYTKHVYTDSKDGSLIVQNSFPRGGVKHTSPDGDEYYYAVFFTQIINKTNSSLELKINFPVDSYELVSLPGRYFKLFLFTDTMALDKASLSNYGLTDLESFLDKNHHKSSSLKRTIKPKESSSFYVIKLNIKPKLGWKGGTGSTRAELIIKEQNLYYRIKNDGSKTNSKSSDIEINCGSINLKHLITKK